MIRLGTIQLNFKEEPIFLLCPIQLNFKTSDVANTI